MLLQLKVYLISVLYIAGSLFMLFFPPRNFEQSGAKMRSVISGRNGELKFETYIEYNQLEAITQKMCREDPEVAKVIHLKPTTSENRSIIALELRSDKQSKKPGILIIGALDGMEWGVPNAILELAEKLLYDSNYQTPFFNDYDWYLVPLANPDAHHYTQKVRSLPPLRTTDWETNQTARIGKRPEEWHKNVEKESEAETCFGTHINRNFAYHWQDDVRKTPARCSQFYPGAKPFSSAEATALQKYVDDLGDVIHLAIHLHASFVTKKELILYPWRYTTRPLFNFRTLQAIGEYAARMSRLPDGRLYEVHQSSGEAQVAGSLIDYLAGVVGTDLVFVLKPYHQKFPNFTDPKPLESYVNKATSAILSLVRGWRSSTKLNTLSFFGTDVEF